MDIHRVSPLTPYFSVYITIECNNDRIRGILDDCAKRFLAEPDEWFPDEENLL